MKKNYRYLMYLLCFTFFSTTTIENYAKSGSFDNVNEPFHEFNKSLIEVLSNETFDMSFERVNVSDLQVSECSNNIIVNTNPGAATATVTYVTPKTNLGGDYVMERITGLSSGSAFPIGVTLITYIERDRTNGLPDGATCEFRVTVNDIEPPVFERCAYNRVIQNPSNICYALNVNNQRPIARDNATATANITYIGTRNDGLLISDAYPVGITTVAWHAKDASGNLSAPCIQTIEVKTYAISKNIEAGTCKANVTWPEPAASPGFSLVRITNLASGSDFPIGATTVTYQERDKNTATPTGRTCSFVVTVVDNKVPVITTYPADKIITERANACYATYQEAAIVPPTATDNCTDVSYITYIGTRDDGNLLYSDYFGKTIITWVAIDESGNKSAPRLQTITVVANNTIAPTAEPIPVYTVDCRSKIPNANTGLIKKIVTNCPIVSKGVEKEEYDPITHVFIRTYFFEDGVGNRGFVEQKYFVNDTFAPVAICKDIMLVLDGNGKAQLHPYQLDNGSFDNCNAGVSFSLTPAFRENIALGKKATQSTTAYGGVASIAVDGNNSGTSVTHTEHFDENKGWWEVDLGASYPIEEIVIWNRTGSFEERLRNFKITLYNASGGVVATRDYTTQPSPYLIISNLTGTAKRIRVTSNLNKTPLSIAEFQVFSAPNAVREFNCSDLGENPITFHVKDNAGNTSSCTAKVNVVDSEVKIEVNNNQFCSGGTLTFTATSANAKLLPSYQWYIGNIAQGTPTTNPVFTPSTIIDGEEVYAEVVSQSTFCGIRKVKSNVIIMTVYPELPGVSAGVNVENNSCLGTAVNLSATPAKGTWSVISGQLSGFSFNDVTASDAVFIGQSGENYTLQWKAYNAISPCDATDTVNIVFGKCENIEFNGTYSYISLGDQFKLDNSSFTIEAWVNGKSLNNNSGTQTIFSKRDPSLPITGYDLSMVNNKLRFSWGNTGNTFLQADNNMMMDKWYHVAITFDRENATYTMIIDGLYTKNKTAAASPLINSKSSLIGARDTGALTPTQYFKGGIDEVRVWNTALSLNQIREMMNQEIKARGNDVTGETVDRIISEGLKWNNLIGYYQMKDGKQAAVTDGKIEDISLNKIQGTLNKMVSSQPETAPIPYRTRASGAWDHPNTWLSGGNQYPNSAHNSIIPGQNQTWNIVTTSHNISTPNRPLQVGSLFLENNSLSVEHDQPLYVKNLKINGTLKLVGESQLLPLGEDSMVDYTGKGTLERDQQGTGNRFNYNYWGSPVSNNLAEGKTYSLNNVLYDGNHKVTWISNNDGSSTTPITLSTRWLYNYLGNASDYKVWKRINPETAIPTGLGFIMKGGGATFSLDKNYTFKGQPNNGTIYVAIGEPNQAAVVGNPYPSAIDANQFIDDNQNVLKDGTLQFWEQSSDGNSHKLADYKGGYAYYTKTGGSVVMAPPIAPQGGSGVGNASKTPTRHIAVGQGFYVEGNSIGGLIEFNNGQRKFMKETGGASIFFRTPENGSSIGQDKTAESSNGSGIQRIRFSFETPEGARRHLLLGFTQDNSASDGIDYGYDAPNNDGFPSDLSFAIDSKQFVIQGVGAFDISKKYPLDMTLKVKGPIEIALTDLENFDESIDVYIHDALLNTYTKINSSNFKIQLDAGNYIDRFYIAFRPDSVLSTIDQNFKEINIKYLQRTKELFVKTPEGVEVKQLHLINIAGQTVKSWNVSNMNESQDLKIPVSNVSEGNYILKVETKTNIYNKKVIIN